MLSKRALALVMCRSTTKEDSHIYTPTFMPVSLSFIIEFQDTNRDRHI